jgi:hypothetical protein
VSVRLLHALLAVAAALEAQTGSLAGVVKETGSGAPLPNVSVWAAREQTKTDAQGRFRFSSVHPGTVTVFFSDKEHGASAITSAVVRAGEEAAIEVQLKLGGSIAGRVLDSARRPVAGAVVLLLARRYQFGEIVFAPAQTAVTDERGEYRIDAVPADRSLLVLAKKRLALTAVTAPPDYDQRERVLTPALHADSPDVRGAQTVTIASRERRAGVDIRLRDTPGYCMEGVVDAQPKNAFVHVSERLSFDSGWTMTPATVRADAEGVFRACGLHPGEYRLMASEAPLGDTRADRIAGWASSALAWGSALVLDKDLRGVRLTEQPSTVVQGDAVYDPAPRDKGGTIQISVSRYVAADGYADSVEQVSGTSGMLGGMMSRGGTSVPGPFSLGRLRSGEWRVEVRQLPAGCYVKSMTYGSQNLLRALLRASEAGGSERVRLTIACDGGSLTARVDDGGKPATKAILYLYDADARTPGEVALNLKRVAVTNGWSAPMMAIPPGKYLAVASDLEAAGESYADGVETLWGLRGQAKPVEIGAGGMVQVSLTFVPR